MIQSDEPICQSGGWLNSTTNQSNQSTTNIFWVPRCQAGPYVKEMGKSAAEAAGFRASMTRSASAGDVEAITGWCPLNDKLYKCPLINRLYHIYIYIYIYIYHLSMGYINRYYINGITLINRLLVGGDWNMAGWFFHSVGNGIIPTDELINHIFQRGKYTTK